MLKNLGKLFLVYNCERYNELIEKLKENNLSPKKIMFVHYDLNKKASMFLVEAIKNGKERGLIVLPPLVLYDGNGNMTTKYENILSGGFLYESEEL